MKENWKVYKETRSRYGKRTYEVSDQGRAKINGILVEFSKDRKYYSFASELFHRIVAKLFVPNPENKPFVDHINTNTHDNRSENLRWVTRKENNNNPLTKKHMSDIKSVQNKGKTNPMFGKQHPTEWRTNHSKKMKDIYTSTKYMNDGITQVKLKPEYWGEFIDIGFKFGTLKKSI